MFRRYFAKQNRIIILFTGILGNVESSPSSSLQNERTLAVDMMLCPPVWPQGMFTWQAGDRYPWQSEIRRAWC